MRALSPECVETPLARASIGRGFDAEQGIIPPYSQGELDCVDRREVCYGVPLFVRRPGFLEWAMLAEPPSFNARP
jgi:hypothetical protein